MRANPNQARNIISCRITVLYCTVEIAKRHLRFGEETAAATNRHIFAVITGDAKQTCVRQLVLLHMIHSLCNKLAFRPTALYSRSLGGRRWDIIYLPKRDGKVGLLPKISSISDMISGVNFSIKSSDSRFSIICSGFEAPKMTVETFCTQQSGNRK